MASSKQIILSVRISKVAVERHTPQSRAIHTTKQIHKRQQKSENNSSNFVTYMGIFIIFGLAYAVFNKYQAWQNSQPEALSVQKVVEVPVVETNFTCDGREHCSQMTSYEEALFFIRNCPNTKMDGDGDGIPCEVSFNGKKKSTLIGTPINYFVSQNFINALKPGPWYF